MADDHLTRPHRSVVLLTAGSLAAALVSLGSSADAAVGPDRPVTNDTSYVKANGRTPTPGDAITACGANMRQQNEPTVAIDPMTPASAPITPASAQVGTVPAGGGSGKRQR